MEIWKKIRLPTLPLQSCSRRVVIRRTLARCRFPQRIPSLFTTCRVARLVFSRSRLASMRRLCAARRPLERVRARARRQCHPRPFRRFVPLLTVRLPSQRLLLVAYRMGPRPLLARLRRPARLKRPRQAMRRRPRRLLVPRLLHHNVSVRHHECLHVARPKVDLRINTCRRRRRSSFRAVTWAFPTAQLPFRAPDLCLLARALHPTHRSCFPSKLRATQSRRLVRRPQ